MELNLQVHDIIRLNQADSILKKKENLPDWVFTSLNETPYVVVRRGNKSAKSIPVGVRGNKKNERYALNISSEQCSQVIKPQSLIDILKKETNNIIDSELNNSFNIICSILDEYSISWGIGGSIGFSLASKKVVHNINSDIDLVFYPENPIYKDWAKNLLDKLEKKVNRQLDIQVLTTNGNFNLKEFSIYDEVLLKTDSSEKIINSNQIWI